MDFVLFLDQPLGGVFPIAGFSRYPKANIPRYIDISFNIVLNNWQGQRSFQLVIKAIKEYQEIVTIQKDNRFYKCLIESQENGVLINRSNERLKFDLNSLGSPSKITLTNSFTL